MITISGKKANVNKAVEEIQKIQSEMANIHCQQRGEDTSQDPQHEDWSWRQTDPVHREQMWRGETRNYQKVCKLICCLFIRFRSNSPSPNLDLTW